MSASFNDFQSKIPFKRNKKNFSAFKSFFSSFFFLQFWFLWFFSVKTFVVQENYKIISPIIWCSKPLHKFFKIPFPLFSPHFIAFFLSPSPASTNSSSSPEPEYLTGTPVDVTDAPNPKKEEESVQRRPRSQEQRIKETLLKGYDKTSRPVHNDSTAVNVSVGMSLFHILDTVRWCWDFFRRFSVCSLFLWQMLTSHLWKGKVLEVFVIKIHRLGGSFP